MEVLIFCLLVSMTSVMIICHIRSFHQKDNYVLMLATFPWMSDWLII